MSNHRRVSRLLAAGALALSLGLAPAAPGHAGNGEGHVTLLSSFIGLYGSGNVYFWTETSTNPPACIPGYNRDGKSHRFVFNLNSAEGKAFFQVLMSAKLLGKKIFIFGTGACDIASDSESVASMRFLD